MAGPNRWRRRPAGGLHAAIKLQKSPPGRRRDQTRAVKLLVAGALKAPNGELRPSEEKQLEPLISKSLAMEARPIPQHDPCLQQDSYDRGGAQDSSDSVRSKLQEPDRGATALAAQPP